MADTPPFAIPRRTLLVAPLAAALPAEVLAQRAPTVTVLGDSITAGYGLAARMALPAQLQASLAALGRSVLVRGAGVSGDTTAGGAARVDFSVPAQTRLCVVALGGNDLLLGLSPKTVQANLDRILRRLKARRIQPVLAGLRVPVEIGQGYARDFNAIFPRLAAIHGVPLYPDLLAGVARVRGLNQPDGIHPNAQGVVVIARGLAPLVARTLAQG